MNINFREKLYTESEEQFNLPVDVVYYVESEWDYKTNNYFLKHHQELEKILNEGNHLLKYKLCYIYRDSRDSQVQALFPTIAISSRGEKSVSTSWFARWRKYKKELEMKAQRIRVNNSDFRTRLVTHIMPNQKWGKEHLGFFAYDIEGINPKEIKETLRSYIKEVEKYNNRALTKGILYSYPEPKIRFDIECRDEVRPAPTPDYSIGSAPMRKVSKRPKKEDTSCRSIELADEGPNFSVIAKKEVEDISQSVVTPRIQGSAPSEDRIRFSIGSYSSEPDENEMEALRALAERIKKDIDELQRKNGINILTELLSDEHKALIKQPLKVSQMTIDSKFRIWLDDYNHLEIKMPTLCKAVYFLFLEHPEGIYLKDMWDYHDELREIYMTISLRTNLDQMERSIYELVDPTSDSLQQKLSKIAAAFRTDLATDFAKLYTINGKRGEAYGIGLDHSELNLSQEIADLFARLQK